MIILAAVSGNSEQNSEGKSFEQIFLDYGEFGVTYKETTEDG